MKTVRSEAEVFILAHSCFVNTLIRVGRRRDGTATPLSTRSPLSRPLGMSRAGSRTSSQAPSLAHRWAHTSVGFPPAPPSALWNPPEWETLFAEVPGIKEIVAAAPTASDAKAPNDRFEGRNSESGAA